MQKPRTLIVGCRALCLAGFILATTATQAALLVYEGFDQGGDGVALNGLGAGPTATGLTGTWAVNDDAIVHRTDSGGMLFPANVTFASAPGRIEREQLFTPVIGTIAMDQAAGAVVDMDTEGKVYFLSFLFRNQSADPNQEATVTLANSSQAVHFGYLYSDQFAIDVTPAANMPYEGSGAATSVVYPGNEPYFVVGKVVVHSSDVGPDELYLKVYNSLTDPADVTEPAEWTITATRDITGLFDHLGADLAGRDYPALDEIRLGTAWEDVVKATAQAQFTIREHPQSLTVAPGATATFTVLTGGAGPVTYQWLKGTTPLANQTAATLTLTNVTPADGGSYTVRATGNGITLTSSAAILTVATNPAPQIALYPGIQFEGVLGLHYRVDYREALDPADAWQALQDIPSLPVSPYRVYDPTSVAQKLQRYYQVVVLP
jgi:hypothetical protein